MQGEPIRDILKRYEGQDVFVLIEVLTYDRKTLEPLTGRFVAAAPDAEQLLDEERKLKHSMMRWVGRRSEVIILHANFPI